MSIDIVTQAKADLIAAGKDLSGNDGAFLIVMEAASRIPGAGVLDKPSGNHAVFNGQSYAVDIIAFPDGRIVDCLVDGGGANTPSWDTSKAPVDPARFRPAVSILGAIPPVVVPPVVVPPTVDLSEVLTKLQGLHDEHALIIAALGDVYKAQVAGTAATERLIAAVANINPNTVTFPDYVTRAFGGTVVSKPR